MSRKKYYAYDIDVSLNGEKLRPAWVTGTLRDAAEITRREGRRMWNGGKGVFKAVRCVARRRADGKIILDWRRGVAK